MIVLWNSLQRSLVVPSADTTIDEQLVRMHRLVDVIIISVCPTIHFSHGAVQIRLTLIIMLSKPRRQKSYLRTCALNEDTDQHVRSLGAFWIAIVAKFLNGENQDSDQTARQCSLIGSSLGACVRKYVFSSCGSNVFIASIISPIVLFANIWLIKKPVTGNETIY